MSDGGGFIIHKGEGVLGTGCLFWVVMKCVFDCFFFSFLSDLNLVTYSRSKFILVSVLTLIFFLSVVLCFKKIRQRKKQ